MDDSLLLEALIDTQVELKAIHDCLLMLEIPYLTIQEKRKDAMLGREEFRKDALKRLAEIRALALNAP